MTEDETKMIALWRSVIARALDDLKLIRRKDRTLKQYAKIAQNWFDISNRDFIHVCNYADLAPDLVIKKASSIVTSEKTKK